MNATHSDHASQIDQNCHVRVCRCGCIYLTIGPTTLKMSPEIFSSVVATLSRVVITNQNSKVVN
jgi:hypothetical protein